MQGKGNKVPIYVQIKEDIKHKINAGEFGAAELLPSEREMCTTYGASRMTVRQAINELQNEGYLYRIQGKGTFVSSAKVEQQLSGLSSFSEDMERLGYKPGSRIVAFKSLQADALLAEKLHVAQGDPVLMLKRLRTADAQNMAIETAYLNARLVTGIEMDDSDHFSLYHYLKHTLKIPLLRSVETIQSTMITGKSAQLLQVPENMLGLLIERITYTERDLPVEYVISQYRGDLYKFVIEMKA